MTAKPAERMLLIAATVALLLVACGGDDDPAAPDDTSDATTAPSTTQPGSSDSDAVRPYIEDLLAAWDDSLTDVLADPRPVAEDSDHRLRKEMAESFTDDSPYIEDLGELLSSGYVGQDVGIRPGPSGRVQETTLLQFTESADEDHVSFVFCSYLDGVEYVLSTGAERGSGIGIRHGAGEAVRVDGRWLLHRLRRLGVESQPVGTPNPCIELAAGVE